MTRGELLYEFYQTARSIADELTLARQNFSLGNPAALAKSVEAVKRMRELTDKLGALNNAAAFDCPDTPDCDATPSHLQLVGGDA